MKYTLRYGIFHWLIHYAIAYALVWSTDFHLVDFIIPLKIFGYTFQANIIDHFIIYFISSLIDLDHLFVYKKFGKKGLMVFATERITYPLHNFFFLSLFAGVSAFTAIFGFKIISVILFTPVLHMGWDIFEDAVIFRKSYRKWEKTWGLKTKDLEKLWNDMVKKKIEK